MKKTKAKLFAIGQMKTDPRRTQLIKEKLINGEILKQKEIKFEMDLKCKWCGFFLKFAMLKLTVK